MQNTFTAGFLEWWKASISNELSQLAGPIFQDEVPETYEGVKVTYPYSVFFAENTDTDYTSNKIYFELWKVSVHIYALGSDTADRAGKLATELLTNPIFGYDSGAVMRSVPDTYQLDSMVIRTNTGLTVYRARCATEMLVRTGR